LLCALAKRLRAEVRRADRFDRGLSAHAAEPSLLAPPTP